MTDRLFLLICIAVIQALFMLLMFNEFILAYRGAWEMYAILAIHVPLDIAWLLTAAVWLWKPDE